MILEKADGEWVRHWNKAHWFGKRGFMSRDQLRPLVWTMALYKDRKTLRRLAWNIIKRFGFLWNTKHIGQQTNKWKTPDFSGPAIWGTIIRGLTWWPLYPLVLPVLLLLDIELVIMSLIRVIMSFVDPDDVGDDLNHIDDMLGTRVLLPTPLSWIARLIYWYGRGRAGETRKTRIEGLAIQTALDHYFRPPEAPPINVFYISVIKRWMHPFWRKL